MDISKQAMLLLGAYGTLRNILERCVKLNVYIIIYAHRAANEANKGKCVFPGWKSVACQMSAFYYATALVEF